MAAAMACREAKRFQRFSQQLVFFFCEGIVNQTVLACA